MDLVLTGRKVDVEDALQIGLREYLVPYGQGREKAEELAKSLLQFPESCMKAERWSVRNQRGLPEQDALRKKCWNNKAELSRGGIARARRFASDKGRGGSFKDLQFKLQIFQNSYHFLSHFPFSPTRKYFF